MGGREKPILDRNAPQTQVTHPFNVMAGPRAPWLDEHGGCAANDMSDDVSMAVLVERGSGAFRVGSGTGSGTVGTGGTVRRKGRSGQVTPLNRKTSIYCVAEIGPFQGGSNDTQHR